MRWGGTIYRTSNRHDFFTIFFLREHLLSSSSAGSHTQRHHLAMEGKAAAREDAGLFLLNVTLKVKPERREEFIACIKANQQGTLANEPLAVLYQWGESTTEPDTFHFQVCAVLGRIRNTTGRGSGVVGSVRVGSNVAYYVTSHMRTHRVPLTPLPSQEAYRGKAGFDAHTETPHFQAWEVFAGTDPFTAEPEVLFFTES